MRTLTLALILASLAAPGHARNVLATHFGNPALPSPGCFVRDYDADHLASHPDQLVKNVSLGISPLSEGGKRPKLMLFVFLRGDDYYYSTSADCRPKGANLACKLESGKGSFTLSAETPSSLRLTVGRDGLAFPGGNQPFISGTRGDDRVFVIPNVDGDYCN